MSPATICHSLIAPRESSDVAHMTDGREVWGGMQEIIAEEQAKGHFGREMGADGPMFAPGATHALAPKGSESAPQSRL